MEWVLDQFVRSRSDRILECSEVRALHIGTPCTEVKGRNFNRARKRGRKLALKMGRSQERGRVGETERGTHRVEHISGD